MQTFETAGQLDALSMAFVTETFLTVITLGSRAQHHSLPATRPYLPLEVVQQQLLQLHIIH
jgi:hypothetical protein